MRHLIKIFVLGVGLFILSSCEWELASIHHDGDSAPLVLITDNNANNFVKLEIRYNPEDPTVITAEDLEGDGKVVYRKRGQDVLRLHSSNFSITEGGEITITYLKRFGITGNTYEDYIIHLERASEEWFLSHNGARFSKIEIRSGRLGIESIRAQ